MAYSFYNSKKFTVAALIMLLTFTLNFTSGVLAAVPPQLSWMDASLAPEVRANLLVNAMTLDQKIQQLAGKSGAIPELPECGSPGRHVPGIPELGIPTFRITNGPVGLGGGDCSPQDKATALPVALGLAASFDTDLAYKFGDLMGQESRTLGLHELESPGMNLARVGEGGRNFEYFGEDPYLSGTMASKEIRGIQANNIIAMSKHYVLNDQEQNRMSVNVNVYDNVLHELYLLPFEMSVKDGGVGSIMCSYNRIGGTYACENPYTLNTVLRDMWGFKGYVQSDFGATHSTAPALNAGLDFEMQSASNFSVTKINAALADGSLKIETINQALYRRYLQMFRFGIFDRPIVHGTINAIANGTKSREMAEQTAVLLKNEGQLLPLKSTVTSIALIGQSTFVDAAVAGGGGSSRVQPLYTVTPLTGLQNALTKLGSNATINKVTVANNNSNLSDAVAAAQAADVVILMAGVVTSEGSDRPDLSLPNNQDALISAIAAANNKTVLVLKDGDSVLMPWVNKIPAILEAWNPGQEDGNAVANLLFGFANPSGKLPVTYPVAKADTPTSSADRYPGIGSGIPQVYYSEGLQMGYRWYDSQNIKPQFAFGYGLSYTNFKISNLSISQQFNDGNVPIEVSFLVKNTGNVAGAEVPQVYLGLPTIANEPPKRLVGFKKVSLSPGEEKQVKITIDPAASNHPLSIWDTTAQTWKTLDGKYDVYVGNSSENINLTSSFRVHHTMATLSGKISVNKGETFALKYGLKNVTSSVYQGIYGQDLTVNFDPSQFEFVGASSLKSDLAVVSQTPSSDGTVRIMLAGLGKGITADSDFLNIQFRPKADLRSPKDITLSYISIAGSNGEKVNLSNVGSYKADINKDGFMDIGDLAIIAAAYGKTSGSADRVQYKTMDFNNDNIINIIDLVFVAQQIN
ncbi:glycoside hydrolase family 3 C-terminal domain-containing protein [Paenibacillus radicis (ex Xue et al. 2023)]|uniref:Glycoside hydrolase family 3 C-terminal domain-containing protein n=1 Tax=Paenibacillus radicis (ex Xue et al. 2023) TaxID=2972489 RepID=A0ABT1YPA7_9BACL|nr:glycoside hydrolase family 3 C-terminal domain-containing protein [Paenibacillus radicis (ex Xue et al. 2023)]MCR8634214.1 glycoside hydrolase family 3 C-terminal domain-containing protein [Paenibacillus radicis (ex Xue et al. 2023)]